MSNVRNGTRFAAVGVTVAVLMAVVGAAVPSYGSPRSPIRTASTAGKSVAGMSLTSWPASRPAAGVQLAASVKKKSARATTTTRKPRAKVPTTTKIRRPTVAKPVRATSTSTADAPVVSAVGGAAIETVDTVNESAPASAPTSVGNPVPLVTVGGAPSPSTPLSTTSTTLAPYPAPANLPLRATAATITPYYGLGTWIDAFDWTVQKGGRIPKVSAQTVDAMAANGVQTLFVQAARFDSADVAEPERLLPIINRAHDLGLYVVVWYLPTFTDVNADLRRSVAIANLDVDGISIDIEARDVANVIDRNQRLLSYSQSLRALLPGRFIANNIVQPNILDAVPNLWPTEYGKPPAVPTSYWALFPYVDIASYYDLWMIQSYWTQRSTGGGWRDAYRISIDNASRLRSILGRSDLPIYLIGGVGDRPMTPNDLAGWLRALAETRSVGASFYDWLVTPTTWWPGLWVTRYVAPGQSPDPRFVAVPPPPYVPPIQPILLPPSTTTTLPPVVLPTSPGTSVTPVTSVTTLTSVTPGAVTVPATTGAVPAATTAPGAGFVILTP
jgi:hypothetical protein